MAYINQTTASLQDFLEKLSAFAVANGWTEDEYNAGTGRLCLSKSPGANKIFVSFRWDTGTPANVGIYQALAWVPATDPGNHTDDSGNGKITGTNALLDDERHVLVADAPKQWWGFEEDHYIHAVFQSNLDRYHHIGFGLLDKVGDWDGGEYCYGFRYQYDFSNSVAVLGGTSMLLDGLAKDVVAQQQDMQLFAATLHAEGLPNQDVASKWAVVMGDHPSTDLGVDRATEARIHVVGGFRGGPIARAFGRFSADSEKGLIPMYPIAEWYWDRTTDDVYHLGFMKDVRGVNMEYFVAGDEKVIGGETWVLFPSLVKSVGGILLNTSAFQGIAYRKIV